MRRVWTPGTALGGLFVAGGIEERLRVNGHVVATDDDVVVAVEEVFLQCSEFTSVTTSTD